MSYRVFAVQYYYPAPYYYVALYANRVCKGVGKHAAPLNQTQKPALQPDGPPKAPEIVAPAQLIADEFRTLAAAQEKTAADVAALTRTITHQTAIIDQQARAIEDLRHGAAAVGAGLFGFLCLLIALLAVLSKRRPAKPPIVPAADDLLGGVLHSTRGRS